ncbi:MAG: glycosyltransferase family 4 protein, partial [Pseudomonadota bacterium]
KTLPHSKPTPDDAGCRRCGSSDGEREQCNGNDPLPRLVRALTIARERGVEARLVVIGPDQQDLPDSIANAPGVIVEGFIDKTTDCDRFLDIVGNCDVGCLLSEAEAGGISLREFGRFGLPVIAPNVGGAKEYVVPGAAQLFDETATDDRIADVIHQLASNREWRENMKQAAQSQKSAARWDPAITQIREIMSDR